MCALGVSSRVYILRICMHRLRCVVCFFACRLAGQGRSKGEELSGANSYSCGKVMVAVCG